jgi:hypothetical protein
MISYYEKYYLYSQAQENQLHNLVNSKYLPQSNVGSYGGRWAEKTANLMRVFYNMH